MTGHGYGQSGYTNDGEIEMTDRFDTPVKFMKDFGPDCPKGGDAVIKLINPDNNIRYYHGQAVVVFGELVGYVVKKGSKWAVCGCDGLVLGTHYGRRGDAKDALL